MNAEMRVRQIVDEITNVFDAYDHNKISKYDTFIKLLQYKDELSNMSNDYHYPKVIIYSINCCMAEMLKLENKELDDSVNNIISQTRDIIEWTKEE